MAMYYPGRVSLYNGPTAIMPQTQYWATNHEYAYQSENRLDKDFIAIHETAPSTDDWRDKFTSVVDEGTLAAGAHAFEPSLGPESERLLAVDGGTLVLVHFDIAHRGSRRLLLDQSNGWDDDAAFRPMFKLAYLRASEPVAGQSVPLRSPVVTKWPSKDTDKTVVWDSIWRWQTNATTAAKAPAQNRPELVLPQGKTEKERVGWAYSIGYHLCAGAVHDSAAVEALVTTLLRPEEELRRAAMNGAAAAGAIICPRLCDAVRATLDGPFRPDRFSVLAGLAHALGHSSPGDRHDEIDTIVAILDSAQAELTACEASLSISERAALRNDPRGGGEVRCVVDTQKWATAKAVGILQQGIDQANTERRRAIATCACGAPLIFCVDNRR